jgi:hypothetical protein
MTQAKEIFITQSRKDTKKKIFLIFFPLRVCGFAWEYFKVRHVRSQVTLMSLSVILANAGIHGLLRKLKPTVRTMDPRSSRG